MPWHPPAPPPPPPSDDLHTSKDDADAAQSQYQEFVRRAITRDSEKADTDAAQSRARIRSGAITRDSEKKR